MFGIGGCKSEKSHGQSGSCGPTAMLKQLNLTDEQLERVADLKLGGMQQCAQMKTSFGEMIKRLVHELTQDSINKNKIHEIAQQVKTEKSKMVDSMLERIISFAEILAPQQRKKLKTAAIKHFLGFDFAEGQA